MRRFFLLLLTAALVAPAARLAAQQVYGRPTAVVVSGPDLGTEPPDFLLPWASREGIGPLDQPFTLRSVRGQVVVLLFYAKDFTPTSALELQTFRDRYREIVGEGVVFVGINADSLETHARFARELDLPFRLLSDVDQKVARRFGSADIPGYARNTVYVIGTDGRVFWRDVQFKPRDRKEYEALRRAIQAARTRV